jgi:hypothetical protein
MMSISDRFHRHSSATLPLVHSSSSSSSPVVVSPVHYYTHTPTLLVASLASRTYTAYRRAVKLFLHYTQLKADELCQLTALQLDTCMSHYVQYLFNVHSNRSYAGHTIHGIAFFFPQFPAHALHTATRCLRGWEKIAPSIQRLPMPYTLMWCITFMCITITPQCLFQQHRITTYQQQQIQKCTPQFLFQLAISIVLSFDCYLRISEMLNLRVSDITVPRTLNTQQHPYTFTCIHLRKTKTRMNQSVLIERHGLAAIIHSIIYGRHGDEYVFNTLHDQRCLYYSCFHSLLSLLPLPPTVSFTPHSLRHGGATHDSVHRHRPVTFIQLRGRWASQHSVLRYIQTRQAVDMTWKLPASIHNIGSRIEQVFEIVVEQYLQTHVNRCGCTVVPSNYFY